ncbi:MAG: polysaccharide deacetylase family protein [Runella slithyformis]|nr:MAG: polysaccharide deacetylase family protein [Runella sp.]TAG21572.1 MAG: polysaccharide deacetylase family protein [Cytophagales bacterium]TAG40835.1 MAG: polysaccharide deacetylase family protein [Cytophagia bacterium]TAG51837.1 MAG: polysaccharide deacetylase family protein [Runella slithyformis]TAG82375.1 MAG: polysaccharide deacetylase family protein [Cytophagales bacterium]
MYHKVAAQHSDGLTVNVAQLEQQLIFLKANGYEFITVAQLKSPSLLPPKSVLLTFDDAYLNNLEYAYPVLKKHQARAVIFVPTAYVGKSSSWDTTAEPLLSLAELRSLDNAVFELGLHAHTHQNFKNSSLLEIRQELTQNLAFFEENQLPFVRALAYPYGGRPKDARTKQKMYDLLQEMAIDYAFRIGNRLNSWPVSNVYEIQRLDIRGNDSFQMFKNKVKWGKWF